ncbi:MAG: tRNA epoxyqueuosine(34) reductase QueG [Myxococcota bacterium]
MSELARERTAIVKREALRLGFDKVGVAAAGPIDPAQRLKAWLAKGAHGNMGYMAETAAAREDLNLYVEGAKSVVALAVSYHWPTEEDPSKQGQISRYARSPDYHNTLRRMLRKLRNIMLRLEPSAQVGPSVDFMPVMERAWAERAGIAWIGKSTMAIARELGTYSFLGALVSTIELIPDEPHLDHCGSCTACLDACPTQAFDGPYQLDARRCITYWNIEERGVRTGEAPPLHGWIGGCDVCQEVCPWNKFAKPTKNPRFRPHPALLEADPGRFAAEGPDPELEAAIDDSPLRRVGREGLRQNARAVLEEGRQPGPKVRSRRR